MKKYPPLISIGGPLLGLLLVIFLINTGINRLQADQSTLREEARLAQSDVAAPEAAAPAEAAAPETAAPEAITPEAAAPEVATPEVAAPAAEATPEAATPLPLRLLRRRPLLPLPRPRRGRAPARHPGGAPADG